jgi:hypothetical protein
MITSAWDDGGVWGEIDMHHNGDFSGEVMFHLNADRADVREEGVGMVSFRLPFAALKQLVAEYVQDRKVAELENASPDQLLGLAGG